MDISEVAAASGVRPSALRYYEEIGLVASATRRGLRRQYEADVLQHLALIGMGRAAGFTLAEIAGMFGRNGSPEPARPELRQHADDVARKARELGRLAQIIRHVADCPAPSHLECPSFQKLLRITTRRHARAAHRPQTARA